jgi:polyhydroxybutyrate depolymerase
VSHFLHNPPSWNDGSPYWSHHDDLAYVAALLDLLPRQFAVDTDRLYVTGFSNGAAFSFRVAVEFGERIAALAPVAGYCWLEQPRLRHPVPTLYLIGTQDPMLPMRGGPVQTIWGFSNVKPPVEELWKKWAIALGCSGESRLVAQERGLSRYRYGPGETGVSMDCCTIEGHGHHWPGGLGQLDESVAGQNVKTFRANDLIWDFFRQ